MKTLSVYSQNGIEKLATYNERGWVRVRVKKKVKTFALICSYTDLCQTVSAMSKSTFSVWMKCMIVCDVCSFKRARTHTQCVKHSIENFCKKKEEANNASYSVVAVALVSSVTLNYLHSILNDVHAYASQALPLSHSLFYNFVTVTNSNL